MGTRTVPLTRAIQCERGTAKFVRQATGRLAAISEDVAAIDHDADRRALGVLIESRAENLILQSQDFDVLPWKIDPTVTMVSDPAVGPDWQSACFRVTLPGGSDGLYQQVHNLTAGETYSFSIFLRSPSGSNMEVTLGGINDTSSYPVTVEPGWKRFTVTEVASSTARYPKVSATTASGPLDVLVWGAMLEVGDRASSYVRSYDSIKVRGADTLISSDLGWLYQGEGTFLLEGTSPASWEDYTHILQLHSGTPHDDHISLSYSATSDHLRLSVRLQQDQLIDESIFGRLALSTDFRIALAYRDNNLAVATNGVVHAPTPGAHVIPRNLTTLILGSYRGTDQFFDGWMKRVSYWPRRLSDSRLSEISS